MPAPQFYVIETAAAPPVLATSTYQASTGAQVITGQVPPAGGLQQGPINVPTANQPTQGPTAQNPLAQGTVISGAPALAPGVPRNGWSGMGKPSKAGIILGMPLWGFIALVALVLVGGVAVFEWMRRKFF
jgi:hypothetical protein